MPSERVLLGEHGLHVVEWGGRSPRDVITLCGSTKFHDDFVAETRRLTLEGNIVISVGLFGHDEEAMYDRHEKRIVRKIEPGHIDYRADKPFFVYCQDHEWYVFKETEDAMEEEVRQHLGARSDFGTDDEPSELKVMLDELHFRKIDMSNRVHIVNPGKYVGLSTSREVAYSMKTRRAITWMDDMDPSDVADVLNKAGA